MVDLLRGERVKGGWFELGGCGAESLGDATGGTSSALRRKLDQ